MIYVNIFAMLVSFTCAGILYINRAAAWIIALNLVAGLVNAGLMISKLISA